PVIAPAAVGRLCRMIRSTVDRRKRSRSAAGDGPDSVSATTRILSPGEERIQRHRRLGPPEPACKMHDRRAMCTMRPAADAVWCDVGGRFPAARGLQDAAPGMTISSLLTPELVLPALPAQPKAEVLETLAAHVGLVHPHVDARRLADALHEPDRQSTAAPESSPRAAPAAPARPQIIVVTTAMLVFISFWRAAAIVLCDMASTVYYIGGIVEQAIGKAAPWYIGAVMLFAYAVRGVYIESCAMFVRGGVYRVVKEAMGGTLAKLSVSALMFDYVLTGPISGVSAGQYIVGLANELFHVVHLPVAIPTAAGSAAIAIAVTLYFWRQNIFGIEESSDKAMKIMGVTTVMVAVMVAW